MEDILLYYTCKYFGEWERVHNTLKEPLEIDYNELEEIKEDLSERGVEYITIYSDEYPPELRQIRKPPYVLFLKGNKELLKNENKVWAYGSFYNQEVEEVVQNQNESIKSNGINLISGYTSEFERGFVNNNPQNIIIVRDSGIESHINMTLAEEKLFIENNLIVSEYPDKEIPSKETWEMSNRIKAGLSEKLYLLNSEKDPVTFKLISETIDDERDVYCFNKDITNKSHNLVLISQGAGAVKEIKDLKK